MSEAQNKIEEFENGVLIPALDEVRTSTQLLDEYSIEVVTRRPSSDSATETLLESLAGTIGQRFGPSLVITKRNPPEDTPSVAGRFVMTVFYRELEQIVFASPAVIFWMRFNNKLHAFRHQYMKHIPHHRIETVTRKHVLDHLLASLDFFKIHAFSEMPFPGYKRRIPSPRPSRTARRRRVSNDNSIQQLGPFLSELGDELGRRWTHICTRRATGPTGDLVVRTVPTRVNDGQSGVLKLDVARELAEYVHNVRLTAGWRCDGTAPWLDARIEEPLGAIIARQWYPETLADRHGAGSAPPARELISILGDAARAVFQLWERSREKGIAVDVAVHPRNIFFDGEKIVLGDWFTAPLSKIILDADPGPHPGNLDPLGVTIGAIGGPGLAVGDEIGLQRDLAFLFYSLRTQRFSGEEQDVTQLTAFLRELQLGTVDLSALSGDGEGEVVAKGLQGRWTSVDGFLKELTMACE